MAKSRSAKFYASHPASRAKKQRYDARLNDRPEQVNKREESNKKRYNAKKNGQNIRGKDYDHATNRFVSIKTNRGRAGEGGRVKFGRRKS